MSIPPRRTQLTRATRPIMLSLVVLIGLIATLYVLQRKVKQQELPADTLKVTVEGLRLNGEPVDIHKLDRSYPTDGKPRKLHVWFDPEMEFGQTWEVQDTLDKLLGSRKNLIVTGLLDR